MWPHKIILKTCGTTTLLLGLDRLLAIAREHCGFDSVWRCFYSRKTFMFPERQMGPHKKWEDEVKFLDETFGTGKGSAYVVGKMNGDHWLLYLTAPAEGGDATTQPASPSAADHLMQNVLSSSARLQLAPQPEASTSKSNGYPANGAAGSSTLAATPPSPPDQTLEILMTHLDIDACKAFYYPPDLLAAEDGDQEGHAAGLQLSQKLGIDTLLQGSTLDSFLFTPCGYSANIVKDDRYATIHVTPEADWSYASFECNVDFRAPLEPDQPHGKTIYDSEALHNLISRVLGIFRPQRLSITLFVSVEESAAGVDQGNTPETKTILDPKVAEGYRRTDRILYEFAGYHLLFSTFEKR